MTKLSVFQSILQAVISLLNTQFLQPAGLGQVIGLLQYAGHILKDVNGTAEELVEINTHIRQLIDEHRPPTDGEWAVWDARLRAVDERFARLKGIDPNLGTPTA